MLRLHPSNPLHEICDYTCLNMKTSLILSFLLVTVAFARAQKVDSIYFNLYTDSLKKGTHNYINVDGKLSDGKWKPLTAKEIEFTTTYGKFEDNELVLPAECKEQKVTVKAVLKSNPAIWKEVTIWVKKKPDDEKLPTKEEILNSGKQKPGKQKSGNNE